MMNDKNTYFILNSLIYNVYNTTDFDKMKRQLLQSLRTMIPSCCATLFVTDDTGTLSDPMCDPHSYIHMELRYPKVKDKDFSDWIVQKKQPMVIRVSDFISDEERMKTDYYKLCFEPFHIHHVIYVTIASHEQLLGLLVLYRPREEEDFTQRDLFLLQLLNEHLNVRFHKELSRRTGEAPVIPGELSLISQYDLTVREAEITQKILSGFTNQELCQELSISIHTLKKHQQNIYRKLNVTGKKQLIQRLI